MGRSEGTASCPAAVAMAALPVSGLSPRPPYRRLRWSPLPVHVERPLVRRAGQKSERSPGFPRQPGQLWRSKSMQAAVPVVVIGILVGQVAIKPYDLYTVAA